MGMKHFFLKKKSKWPTQKKPEFFKIANSQQFKFHGLVLEVVAKTRVGVAML